MSGVSQCNSIERVSVINNELELLNWVYLDVSAYKLSKLFEVISKPGSSKIHIPYLRKI